MKALDLAGKRFGRLVVQSRAATEPGITRWHCSCDCGASHIAIGKLLKRGHTKSCGCLKHDGSSKVTHGHSRRSGHSRTYRAWAKMIERCENPNNKDYPNYGANGITIHGPWHTFINFLADMGECPDGFELDRIEFRGNYEPGNVRWTDEYTQAINRDWTLWVEVDGERMPMKRAAERLGLDYAALRKMTCKAGGCTPAQEAINRLLGMRI